MHHLQPYTIEQITAYQGQREQRAIAEIFSQQKMTCYCCLLCIARCSYLLLQPLKPFFRLVNASL